MRPYILIAVAGSAKCSNSKFYISHCTIIIHQPAACEHVHPYARQAARTKTAGALGTRSKALRRSGTSSGSRACTKGRRFRPFQRPLRHSTPPSVDNDVGPGCDPPNLNFWQSLSGGLVIYHWHLQDPIARDPEALRAGGLKGGKAKWSL